MTWVKNNNTTHKVHHVKSVTLKVLHFYKLTRTKLPKCHPFQSNDLFSWASETWDLPKCLHGLISKRSVFFSKGSYHMLFGIPITLNPSDFLCTLYWPFSTSREQLLYIDQWFSTRGPGHHKLFKLTILIKMLQTLK